MASQTSHFMNKMAPMPVVGRIEQSEIRRHSASTATRESRIIPLSAGFVPVASEGRLYPPYISAGTYAFPLPVGLRPLFRLGAGRGGAALLAAERSARKSGAMIRNGVPMRRSAMRDPTRGSISSREQHMVTTMGRRAL